MGDRVRTVLVRVPGVREMDAKGEHKEQKQKAARGFSLPTTAGKHRAGYCMQNRKSLKGIREYLKQPRPLSSSFGLSYAGERTADDAVKK